MDEMQTVTIVDKIPFLGRHRFSIMIVSSIIVASLLVVVSMIIYNSSGASQLDLSRPGYVNVRSQAVTNDSDFRNYSITGAINQATITEFKSLYEQQAGKAKAVDAFGGDPLNADALGISDVSE